MEINTIQGLPLPSTIMVEDALLELLQLAESNVNPETLAQASTIYGDDTFNATISLPISYSTLPSGKIQVAAISNTIPNPL